MLDTESEKTPFFFQDSIFIKEATILKRSFPVNNWMPFAKGSMKIEGDGFRIDYGSNNLEVKWDDLSEIDAGKINNGRFIANFGSFTQPKIYSIQIDKYEYMEFKDKFNKLFSSLPRRLKAKRCPSCGNHVNLKGTCEKCNVNADASFKKGGLIKLLIGIFVFVVAVIISAKFLQDQNSVRTV